MVLLILISLTTAYLSDEQNMVRINENVNIMNKPLRKYIVDNAGNTLLTFFLRVPRISSFIISTNEQTFPKTLTRGLPIEFTFSAD